MPAAMIAESGSLTSLVEDIELLETANGDEG